MHTDGFASYETWDLTMPVIPPRSRLYNLGPIGFGTPMVSVSQAISRGSPKRTAFLLACLSSMS